MDSPWWNTHAPPNGWGCKCRIRPVTRRERERMLRRDPDRYSTSEPPVRTRTWVNPATGEARQVAEGIDPGWDYNPGAHRTLGVHRALLDHSEAVVSGRGRALPDVRRPVREAVVRSRIQGYLAGPGFRWLMERPRATRAPRWDRASRGDVRRPPVEEDAVPVAVLSPQQMEALGAMQSIVRLEAGVADKQWRRHGPGQGAARNRIPVEWYADIQDMMGRTRPLWDAQRRNWVYDDRATRRRLVIGVDDRGYLFVQSLHRRFRRGRPK